MDRLKLRAPGAPVALDQLLHRVLPSADAVVCHDMLARGAVHVAGRPARRAGRPVPPGALVEIDVEREDSAAHMPPPLPQGRSESWIALVATPPYRRGTLAAAVADPSAATDPGQPAIAFELVEGRDGVAEVALHAERSVPAAAVLTRLAGAGWPVLGDAFNGGVAVASGARLLAVRRDATRPTGWWPESQVFPTRGPDGALPDWRISAATQRVLRRGHPWILLDTETEDPERYPPGALVRVVGPDGRSPGVARIEGAGRPAARMWDRASEPEPASAKRRSGAGRRGRGDRGSRSIEARVAAALDRRRGILEEGRAAPPSPGAARRPYTDAVRMVHGEADGLPGLVVDRLASTLRVLVLGASALPLVERVTDALLASLAEELGAGASAMSVLHLRDRPRGELECVRWLRAPASSSSADSLVVHERGLAFRVEPGLLEPTVSRPGFGLYLDQRENRARLAARAARGGAWLNLFAHTGAFSVALLAAGAEAVVSVDLSAPYLDWLEENLQLNSERGVDPRRHTAVKRDGRRYLAELPAGERFAGIVLDPPTAAASGRRFWSVGRDLEALTAAALERLEPRGVLLLSRNQRAGRGSVAELVRRAASQSGIRLKSVEVAGPGADFPRLKGFPEGDSFTGVLAERA